MGKGFQQRTLRHSEAKCVLAKALQRCYSTGTPFSGQQQYQLVYGTPDTEMALTVITPSVAILQALMSRRSLHPDWSWAVIFSPTENFLRRNDGTHAARICHRYVFFSCQGLERDSGLYAGTDAHAAG